mmetsp:Transcript_3258/g.8426  ORF Transcript_3258/g.8426 Transcript_3258/m.8426 type:complete len:281 (-) Transcript_3258:572-1414(-)
MSRSTKLLWSAVGNSSPSFVNSNGTISSSSGRLSTSRSWTSSIAVGSPPLASFAFMASSAAFPTNSVPTQFSSSELAAMLSNRSIDAPSFKGKAGALWTSDTAPLPLSFSPLSSPAPPLPAPLGSTPTVLGPEPMLLLTDCTKASRRSPGPALVTWGLSTSTDGAGRLRDSSEATASVAQTSAAASSSACLAFADACDAAAAASGGAGVGTLACLVVSLLFGLVTLSGQGTPDSDFMRSKDSFSTSMSATPFALFFANTSRAATTTRVTSCTGISCTPAR